MMRCGRFCWLLLLALSWAEPGSASPVTVDTAWLADHLEDSGLVLVDMTADPVQYRRFHLPGARYLSPRALVDKNKAGVSLRVPARRLFALLGELGINADSHVVIYDDMGGLEAGRLFWELERSGHAQASVLDGGLVKWVLEGRPVVAEVPPMVRAHYRPAGPGRANEIDLAGVLAARKDPSVVLLDVRTPEEYAGKPSDPRTGHIPGAHLWPWDQAVDFEHGFVLKRPEVLLRSLRQAGIEGPDADVVLYCRSGHRAAQTYATLRSLGFERLRLYDGSMAEYGLAKSEDLRRGPAP